MLGLNEAQEIDLLRLNTEIKNYEYYLEEKLRNKGE